MAQSNHVNYQRAEKFEQQSQRDRERIEELEKLLLKGIQTSVNQIDSVRAVLAKGAKMTRRQGIITAVAGALPMLAQEFSFKQLKTPNPMYVHFMGDDQKVQFSVGWDREKEELVVVRGGKTAQISGDEIMDALTKGAE